MDTSRDVFHGGTPCAVKVARTVWVRGKVGDNIKNLPIDITYLTDITAENVGGIAVDCNCAYRATGVYLHQLKPVKTLRACQPQRGLKKRVRRLRKQKEVTGLRHGEIKA